MSFLHGSDFSRLFLHTANICFQRQDTLVGAFCATKSTSWYYAPMVVVSELRFLTVYRDTASLPVKVSKLIHLRT